MAISAPHFAYPFRLTGAGSFGVVEQDSDPDVVACVAICLATPFGSRAEVPDYGVPPLEFDLPDPSEIAAALEDAEPRANVDVEALLGGLSGEETVAQLTVLVANAATGEDDT